ncbi:MAG: rod shape-determining protein [Minisyncoccia bacterium]
MVKRIGIDLGTANVLVFLPNKGIVVDEPSVVAVDLYTNSILAVGNQAKEMIGRTPDGIKAVRPIRDGVIADYRMTEALIGYLIQKVSGRIRIFRPDCIISVPASITSTEKRAVIEVALNVGAKNAYVVKEPILAALGAGIPIDIPSGNMVIDIGGGTTEVGVISLGGIVAFASARVAGDKLTEAIITHIKKKYSLAIGEQTAEDIKKQLGSALPIETDTMDIRGRDVLTGLPKHVTITSEEVTIAMQAELREIIQTVKNVLQETPPELASDIIEKGIIITGGGALLKNIAELISKSTGVPCSIADDPLYCVAKGTGIMLDSLDKYKRVLGYQR